MEEVRPIQRAQKWPREWVIGCIEPYGKIKRKIEDPIFFRKFRQRVVIKRVGGYIYWKYGTQPKIYFKPPFPQFYVRKEDMKKHRRNWIEHRVYILASILVSRELAELVETRRVKT